MSPERGPRIKVTGGDTVEREAVVGMMRAMRKNPSPTHRYEKPHSPEFDSLVAAINEHLATLLGKYDVPYTPIHPTRLKIVDWKRLPKDHELWRERRAGAAAVWDVGSQCLYILKKRTKKPGGTLELAQNIAHDLVHASSIHSLQIRTASDPWSQGRAPVIMQNDGEGHVMGGAYSSGVGLEIMGNGGKTHFTNLNEAVTEELARELDAQHFHAIPALTNDLLLRREAHKAAREGGMSAENITERQRLVPAGDGARIVRSPYPGYRSDMHNLIDDILDIGKGQEGFPHNRDEAWRLFVAAVLKGDILPLARLIERAYGKGAFRYLGEMGEARER